VTHRAFGVAREDGRRLFGLAPDAYASGRPGYPDGLFEILVGRCGLGPGVATLEVGPGAGQATGELLARGAAPLTVVEPDPGFAAYLTARFGDEIRLVGDAFEDAVLPRRGFALAVAATSWHWVDQQAGLARVHRLLAPGGWWACWWNVFHDPAGEPDELFRALEPILPTPADCAVHTQNGPAELFVLDRAARRADLERAGFAEVEVTELRWALTLDPGRARALFATFSPLIALAPDEREPVLDEIARVLEERFDGLFERRCVTVLYTARRP
jgi:SAM-dependent methyltransferase